MRVSEFYNLRQTQPDLDFVDVDVTGDVRLFIDPRALRRLDIPWAHGCVALLQDFFEEVLRAIKSGNTRRAQQLLASLSEPNETHLGFSRGKARGHAMGRALATNVATALSKSQAVKSGLLVDLEDTILMVEGIDADIVSDIATNIIREPLILYTQAKCLEYRIPTRSNVDSGPLWKPDAKQWDNRFETLPIAGQRKLVLVPKLIVRRRMEFEPDDYYKNFILQYLRELELSDPKSQLVRLLKSGRRRVTTQDLMEKYGRGKRIITELTLKYPQLLQGYKEEKTRNPQEPLDHDGFADAVGTPEPDWDALLLAVRSTPSGEESADAFHRAIEELLTALLWPELAQPELEYRIHQGRKRVDIRYTNDARKGFFRWVNENYRAPYIWVECKNYAGDPANPELDQIAGRFSPQRGRVGLLVCRPFEDKALFIERCRDTAKDDRGYVIPLDDDDLAALVQTRKELGLRRVSREAVTALLRHRFDQLIM